MKSDCCFDEGRLVPGRIKRAAIVSFALMLLVAACVAALTEEGEVGRRMDFLLQEMNRETNTIGSKASNIDITQDVMEVKCLLEKLREQVQNVV